VQAGLRAAGGERGEAPDRGVRKRSPRRGREDQELGGRPDSDHDERLEDGAASGEADESPHGPRLVAARDGDVPRLVPAEVVGRIESWTAFADVNAPASTE
jgi:hypothetical protein